MPMDGSRLSEAATKKGMQLAKSISARVTGFHVTPDFACLPAGRTFSREEGGVRTGLQSPRGLISGRD